MILWRLIRRIAITIIALIIIGIGIPLLILPGPGILIILAGLGLLAWEYPILRQGVDKLRRKKQDGPQGER